MTKNSLTDLFNRRGMLNGLGVARHGKQIYPKQEDPKQTDTDVDYVEVSVGFEQMPDGTFKIVSNNGKPV